MDLPPGILDQVVSATDREGQGALALTSKALREAVLLNSNHLTLRGPLMDRSERSLSEIMTVLRRHKPIDLLVLESPSQAADIEIVEAVLSDLASQGGASPLRKLRLTGDHSSDVQSP